MKKISILNLVLYYTIIVFILPIMIIGFGSILIFYFYTNDLLISKNAFLVKSISHRIQQQIGDVGKHVIALSELIENEKRLKSDRIDHFVESIFDFNMLESISIFSDQNKMVNFYPPVTDFYQFDSSYNDKIQLALEERHAFWSAMDISMYTGTPLISFTSPIFVDNEISGVISVNLKVDHLLNFAQSFNDPVQGIMVLITDQHGNFIVHPYKQKVYEMENFNILNNSGSFLTPTFEMENEKYLVAFDFISELNWNVFFLQNADKAFKPIQNIRILLIIVFLLGLIISIVSDYFGISVIFKPLTQISMKTTKIANGKYDLDFQQYKIKEINQLVNNYKKMVTKIFARENDLKEKEVKYRKLVEDSIDFIFRIKKDLSITFASSSIEKILGYSNSYFLENFADLKKSYKKLLPNNKMNMEALIITKNAFKFKRIPISFYLEVRHAEGFSIYLEIQENPIVRDNEVIEIQGTARDSTSRFFAEQNASYFQKYLFNIIESMPSSIITFDELGNINHLNSSALNIIGKPLSQIQGRKLWEVSSKFKGYKKYFDFVYKSKKTFEFKEEDKVSRQETRYYNLTIYPLQSANQELVLRIDDISKLENTEIQLRQAQKLKTIGTMSGGLAHDFNNILGAILGTLTLIEYRTKNNKVIQYNDFIDDLATIKDAANKAKSITQQLMSLAKNQNINYEAFDLNQEIIQVINICNKSFTKLIKLEYEIPDEQVMIMGAKSQIEQMILNLIINAKDAMSESGCVRISVERVIDNDFAIQYNLDESNDYWMIKVSDDGQGIPEEIKDSIFEPFISSKESGKGVGLGLTMVYNIVKSHQGAIEFDSEIGKGTTFYVYLPGSESSQIKSDHNQSDETIVKGKGTVLVIDDEKYIRNTARQMLEECGYRVFEANNGLSGLEIYKKQPQAIDIVILDVFMPEMTGKETYIQIKKIDKNAKILLSSGINNDPAVLETMKLGVDGFLLKPYSIQELSIAVNSVLNP